MITSKNIKQFREYLASGRWEEDFGYMTKDGQDDMLDLLDSLFELCELADKVLTKKLYKNMLGGSDVVETGDENSNKDVTDSGDKV